MPPLGKCHFDRIRAKDVRKRRFYESLPCHGDKIDEKKKQPDVRLTERIIQGIKSSSLSLDEYGFSDAIPEEVVIGFQKSYL